MKRILESWRRYLTEEKKTITEAKLNHEFKQRILPYYKVHGLTATLSAINQRLVKSPAYGVKVTRELEYYFNQEN